MPSHVNQGSGVGDLSSRKGALSVCFRRRRLDDAERQSSYCPLIVFARGQPQRCTINPWSGEKVKASGYEEVCETIFSLEILLVCHLIYARIKVYE
ncbi:hypothetical protein TNIN_46721 [Trichonephila inaurata madagascariensis]|uniref:Uncharacterized protein n=1 Tax=Trichonephila inaurata madagascariensis TaxID=2747483 RepID=A0A8X7C6V3_9ARAC|nr:hypothetical protein TNIN_46721 [Trichonephila inaurata madagascariensis]